MIDYAEEIPHIVDRLAALEEVLITETELIENGMFDQLATLTAEKSLLVPVLNRAQSLLQALIDTSETNQTDLADDPALIDLAMSLMHLNNAAARNEQALVATIQATQFTIRTVVKAIKEEHTASTSRYNREAQLVADPARRNMPSGLANSSL